MMHIQKGEMIMYENKRFLLIAGGGTLGTYVSEELLRKGAIVEVVCPEEKTSPAIAWCFTGEWARLNFWQSYFPKRTTMAL